MLKTQVSGRVIVPAGSRIVAAGGLDRRSEGLLAHVPRLPVSTARASSTPPAGKLLELKAAAIFAQMSVPLNTLASMKADEPVIVVLFVQIALSPSFWLPVIVCADTLCGAVAYHSEKIHIAEKTMLFTAGRSAIFIKFFFLIPLRFLARIDACEPLTKWALQSNLFSRWLPRREEENLRRMLAEFSDSDADSSCVLQNPKHPEAIGSATARVISHNPTLSVSKVLPSVRASTKRFLFRIRKG